MQKTTWGLGRGGDRSKKKPVHGPQRGSAGRWGGVRRLGEGALWILLPSQRAHCLLGDLPSLRCRESPLPTLSRTSACTSLAKPERHQDLLVRSGGPSPLSLHQESPPPQPQPRTILLMWVKGILRKNRLGFLPVWPLLPHLRARGGVQFARWYPSGHSSRFQNRPGPVQGGTVGLCRPTVRAALLFIQQLGAG